MNIQTGNGMGLKPTGMQLKPSNGMGIQTQNGMGLQSSKGLGLASDRNYFSFNEYERKRRYFFGDRGKAAQVSKVRPNQVSPTAGRGTQHKSSIYQVVPEPSGQQRRLEGEARQRRGQPGGTKLEPQATPWQPRSRAHPKHGRQVAVYCDCFFCQLDKFTHTRW